MKIEYLPQSEVATKPEVTESWIPIFETDKSVLKTGLRQHKVIHQFQNIRISIVLTKEKTIFVEHD